MSYILPTPQHNPIAFHSAKKGQLPFRLNKITDYVYENELKTNGNCLLLAIIQHAYIRHDEWVWAK